MKLRIFLVLVVGWYQILHGASPYLIQTPTLDGGAIGAAFKRGMEKGRMHEMVSGKALKKGLFL